MVLAEACTSTSEPTKLLTNTALRDSVKKREGDNRPRKCRLCGRAEHRKYLRQWERPQVSAERETLELDFRHGVGEAPARSPPGRGEGSVSEFKASERQSICDLLVPPDGYRSVRAYWI